MQNKMKIYLDTSVISALFDERNPERKILTELFFNNIEDYEIYISNITVIEIENTPDLQLRNKMEEIITNYKILIVNDDVEWLGNEYIKHGAIPESQPDDAYHIAVAVINEMEFLLSWNFKHMVKLKTKNIVKMINTLNKVRQIQIIPPGEL